MSYPKSKGVGPPQWLQYVLYSDAFSLGELQAGYSYDRAAKTKHGETIREQVKVPGTKIPASTIDKFREGFWTPRDKSLNKLYQFYRRWAYHQLRSSGLSRDQAQKNIPYRDPQEVWEISRRMRQVAEIIAANKGLKTEDVLATLQRSTLSAHRWDAYVRQRNYSKVPITESAPSRIVRESGFQVVRYDPASGVYFKPWTKDNIEKARNIYGRKNIITIRKPKHEPRIKRVRGRQQTYLATIDPGLVRVKIEAF